MRVPDPRRVIRWGVLLAVLCLVPVNTPTAFAKPISYTDLDPNNPSDPKGDGDGVVVKAASIQTQQFAMTKSVTSVSRTMGRSWFRVALRLMRLGYTLRLY